MKKFLTRSYLWAIITSLLLTSGSAYVLLDAFVFEKAYAVISESDTNADSSANVVTDQTTTDTTVETVVTSNTYTDGNISIKIETVTENSVVYYVADIQLASAEYLKTAFANNTYGKNITASTSATATANNAIFAINGDFYGFRDTGLIIRNGILYRDVARSSPDNQALILNADGNLMTVTEGTISGTTLIDQGVQQSFSFGPVLVQNSKAVFISTKVASSANPRTALGQISPLHYIIVVVDGRSSTSNGMTLSQLAQVFVQKRCTIAYNLDGGGSSTMWFNGSIINHPTDGKTSGERKVSDIIYIGG